MKFTESVRAAAIARAAGKCELCGMPIQVPHLHHRRPRGMGGSKRPDTGGAANCLVIHPRCHIDVELNRQRSLDNGWLVSQWRDPSTVPVKRWDGLCLLADDGTVIPA